MMEALKTIPLQNGDQIIVRSVRAHEDSWEDVNRNVLLITSNGTEIWRIETCAESDEWLPYTNVWLEENGDIRAYCWNGIEYLVDPNTGHVSDPSFKK